MFSWSSTATKQKASSQQYPGRRSSTSRVDAHVPIEGSIRPPPSSSSEYTRAQHLQSYLEDATLKRSTRRVSSDDTTYDTVFQTTRGETLILRVNIPLSSSFATACPAMTLAGVRVRHPWVNAVMRITGYEPIRSETAWKSSNLLLGKAVHAVVQHMQLNPPTILEITDKGLQAIQAKQNGSSSHSSTAAAAPSSSTNGGMHHSRTSTGSHASQNSSSSHHDAPPSYNFFSQQASLPPAPDVPMPTIPKKYKEVEDKSREELDKYMDDELEFLSLVHHLDVHAKIQDVGETYLLENVKMAQENLEKEPELKQLNAQVHELQASLKQKIQHFQSLEAQQNAICAPPDERDAIRQLKEAKKQAFDESETYADEWIEDGAEDVDKFVKEFVEKRKVHHLRAAKMEILQNYYVPGKLFDSSC